MKNRKLSQNTHFTIKGHWWLPSSSNRVAGELSYEEENISLSLYGGLSDATVESPFNAKPTDREFPIVHGESEDGNQITLVNSFYTQWQSDLRAFLNKQGERVSLRTSRLHSQLMLDGIHLTTEGESFAQCRIEVPFLQAWLHLSPFETHMEGPGSRILPIFHAGRRNI